LTATSKIVNQGSMSYVAAVHDDFEVYSRNGTPVHDKAMIAIKVV
jgi:hypothetical protein